MEALQPAPDRVSMHPVTAARNLLSAMIGNHIPGGNRLGFDPHEITGGVSSASTTTELLLIIAGSAILTTAIRFEPVRHLPQPAR
jgi:hypothetical protein